MSAKVKTINLRRSDDGTTHFRLDWLLPFSSIAALSVGILFLTAMIDLILTVLNPITFDGWLSSFQSIWLITIFKLQAGFVGIQPYRLAQLNLLDIIALALIGILIIGLYIALHRTSKIWSMVALVQPFLGILLFILTKNAGRSGLMGAVLVISIVMLRSKLFDKRYASIGILSGIMLLAGDFGVSAAPSPILAVLTGLGTMLLITWCFLMSRRLFQLGRPVHETLFADHRING